VTSNSSTSNQKKACPFGRVLPPTQPLPFPAKAKKAALSGGHFHQPDRHAFAPARHQHLRRRALLSLATRAVAGDVLFVGSKRIIIVFGAVISLAFWLGVLAVRQYYTLHRAEAPQVELGGTIAVQLNYGKTVYVTSKESRILGFAGEWFIVPLFAVIIYAAFQIRKPKRAA